MGPCDGVFRAAGRIRCCRACDCVQCSGVVPPGADCSPSRLPTLAVSADEPCVLSQVYGMCYLHKYSSFAKNARIQEFLLNVLESLADVLALAGGVIGVASVLQLPAIISLVVLACQGRYQRSDLPLASIREVLIMQPVYALVSWLLFPLWLVSAVGVWRWPVLSEVGCHACWHCCVLALCAAAVVPTVALCWRCRHPKKRTILATARCTRCTSGRSSRTRACAPLST